MLPNKITNIIVHCSDSAFGCVNLIRSWHIAEGWKDIGYHYVILNGAAQSVHAGNLPDLSKPFGASENNPYIAALDGSIEVGRNLDYDSFIEDNEVGAHCLGYNANSVGICLVGQRMTGTNLNSQPGFTVAQFKSLQSLVGELCLRYHIPVEAVLGHKETDSGKAEGKTCPNFDMTWFREKLLRPYIQTVSQPQ